MPEALGDIGGHLVRLAAAAQALAEWHGRHGVHGQLRLASFAVDASGGLTVLHPDPAVHKVSPASLRYASPERAGRLAAIDIRSDLYALGAVFHEWLTGAPPFVADDVLEMVHLHMAVAPPSVRTRNAAAWRKIADSAAARS